MSDEKLVIDGVEYESEWDILDGEDFETVTEETLEEQHRWWNLFSQVAQHKDSGAFFRIYFCRNASESQDGQDLDPYTFEEVVPVEKMVIVYQKKS